MNRPPFAVTRFLINIYNFVLSSWQFSFGHFQSPMSASSPCPDAGDWLLSLGVVASIGRRLFVNQRAPVSATRQAAISENSDGPLMIRRSVSRRRATEYPLVRTAYSTNKHSPNHGEALMKVSDGGWCGLTPRRWLTWSTALVGVEALTDSFSNTMQFC